MTSRERMLAAIRQNKPEASPLPTLPSFAEPEEDLVGLFTEAVEKVGGTVWQGMTTDELTQRIAQQYPDVRHSWSADHTLLPGSVTIAEETLPASLADVDVALLRGTLGVAENGAIWVPEEEVPQRVLAFITQHLILVLDQQKMVWNMHQAYQKLGTNLSGFGLFISGPSKTADIEQSLVVGAHGPRSLTVCLVK